MRFMRSSKVSIPVRRHGYIHRLVFEKVFQKVDIPLFGGFPVLGGASYDEGGVFGDISHKLEGTWLLGELFDDGAVELIVVFDEFCYGVWVVRFILDKATIHFVSGS